MFIKETNLFIETFDFIKKNIIKIFLISIFYSFLLVVSDFYIIPTIQRIYFSVLQKDNNMYSLIHIFDFMTFYNKKMFLQFSFLRNVVYITSITFIIESIIMIAHFKIFEKKNNLYKLYKKFFYIFPNLFVLIFFINVIVQIGLVLLIFPAIIFSIFLSLSPIILMIEKKSMFLSIKKSLLICFLKYKELSFPIILWLLVKFALLTISTIFKFSPENLFCFLYNSISNFFLCILIVYLFKFYSLFKPIKKF
ncbi:YciC family protein [Buchnera aphidicola (Ceratovacuna keduensis)]|uniref:YciC family protein n=1 Tax=Buchnera aphidicola TaxID=9 RepID=UPI0031B82E75